VQREGANCGSPGRAGSGRTLTRVGFLGSGLVTAAGALGVSAAQARAAGTVQVWGLDPNWSDDPVACGCSACSSCLAHASNKLFASAAAADSGRAHPYCKCLVVPLAEIDSDVYGALFRNGGGRDSVDRRHQWVQAVFTHEASAGPSPFSRPGDLAVRPASAALGRVRIRRVNGQRVLFADIDAAQSVNVTLVLTRQGSIVARRVIAGVHGSRRLKLPISAATKAGPARLRVRIHNAATTATINRKIQIPRS
jgi:hypothetical protein